MTHELLTRVLDGIPALRKDGAAYLVPDDLELAVFVALPSEVLSVPRLARLEPTAELLIAETHKGERYFFATKDVAGVKIGAPEKRSTGGAGFR